MPLGAPGQALLEGQQRWFASISSVSNTVSRSVRYRECSVCPYAALHPATCALILWSSVPCIAAFCRCACGCLAACCEAAAGDRLHSRRSCNSRAGRIVHVQQLTRAPASLYLLQHT
jgi:hypothetical protein